jgi:phosphohistidine phosphatase SixA
MSRPEPFRVHFSALFVGLIVAAAMMIHPGGPRADSDTDLLVSALRQGGLVVYLRHASTETDYADQVAAVMGDCSTQRALSEHGWAEARMIGQSFVRLGIPVGSVISSQYCRAWQTADLAFGHHMKSADLNFAPAETYNDAEIAAMRARVLPHLSRVPAPGTNTILVGHDDPFEAATGIYPEPMGVAYVLRPMGEGTFDILGSIAPDAWRLVLN